MVKLRIETSMLIISFIVSIILGFTIIPILKKLKVGQIERDDGPQSHLKKQGTPTMGRNNNDNNYYFSGYWYIYFPKYNRSKWDCK